MAESESRKKLPCGIRLLSRLRGRDLDLQGYRVSILVITFIAYAFYHMSRKPPSIVKVVLDPEDSVLTNSGTAADGGRGSFQSGWAPFDGKTGKARLGEIDVAFLACYAIGMYFAGHLGDRLHLRLFLTVGMVGSGLFVCLFGMGYWWNIHMLSYYLVVQMFAGLFQATGWPSVVTIVGNWFGKNRRGLIMGVWNAHTSVGNILGSLIAASVLKYGWGWSFLLPGLLMASGGLLIYAFLVVEPAEVGLPSPYEIAAAEGSVAAEVDDLETGVAKEEDSGVTGVTSHLGTRDLPNGNIYGDEKESQPLVRAKEVDDPVGFMEAWRIPGVATFSMCLFFAKLVAYTFLYWLPFYIRHTRIAGEYLDDKTAGNLSTLFDVGGVVGGILAGYMSDRLRARAITAASFMYCAIPALFLYRAYGSVSLPVNIGLMMLTGMFINGPYALITTAVSADLGTHKCLKGNARALATVTAIIDGTGSVGAAIGPLLTGYISAQGWDAVFTMLMVAALLSGLLLSKLVIGELVEKFGKSRTVSSAEGVIQDELTGSPTQPLLNSKN